MKFSANTIGFVFLLIASLAWAHGEHEASGLNASAPLWLWAVGGALVLIVATMLIRQAKRGTLIGGGVLATPFVLYYLYFARIDGRPEPVLQPARAH